MVENFKTQIMGSSGEQEIVPEAKVEQAQQVEQLSDPDTLRDLNLQEAALVDDESFGFDSFFDDPDLQEGLADVLSNETGDFIAKDNFIDPEISEGLADVLVEPSAEQLDSEGKKASFEVNLENSKLNGPVRIPKEMNFTYADQVYKIDMEKFVSDNKDYLNALYNKNEEAVPDSSVIKIFLDGQEYSMDMGEFNKKREAAGIKYKEYLAGEEAKEIFKETRHWVAENAAIADEIEKRKKNGESEDSYKDLLERKEQIDAYVDSKYQPLFAKQNEYYRAQAVGNPAYDATELFQKALNEQELIDAEQKKLIAEAKQREVSSYEKGREAMISQEAVGEGYEDLDLGIEDMISVEDVTGLTEGEWAKFQELEKLRAEEARKQLEEARKEAEKAKQAL